MQSTPAHYHTVLARATTDLICMYVSSCHKSLVGAKALALEPIVNLDVWSFLPHDEGEVFLGTLEGASLSGMTLGFSQSAYGYLIPD
jgi:hypothetical protein